MRQAPPDPWDRPDQRDPPEAAAALPAQRVPPVPRALPALPAPKVSPVPQALQDPRALPDLPDQLVPKASPDLPVQRVPRGSPDQMGLPAPQVLRVTPAYRA